MATFSALAVACLGSTVLVPTEDYFPPETCTPVNVGSGSTRAATNLAGTKVIGQVDGRLCTSFDEAGGFLIGVANPKCYKDTTFKEACDGEVAQSSYSPINGQALCSCNGLCNFYGDCCRDFT